MLSLARRASAFCRTLLFPALAPDSQPVLARAAGDGVKQARPRREKVSFLIPGQAPLVSIHVTQRSLSNLLDKSGAIGFEVADGAVSQELEDLPEGAAVHLVMPKVPSFATQVPLVCLHGKEEGHPLTASHSSGLLVQSGGGVTVDCEKPGPQKMCRCAPPLDPLFCAGAQSAGGPRQHHPQLGVSDAGLPAHAGQQRVRGSQRHRATDSAIQGRQ